MIYQQCMCSQAMHACIHMSYIIAVYNYIHVGNLYYSLLYYTIIYYNICYITYCIIYIVLLYSYYNL